MINFKAAITCGSKIYDNEIALKTLVEENGIKNGNKLELTNVVFELNNLKFNNENQLINQYFIENEDSIKFAKKEFEERYKYKLIEHSLLNKLNNKTEKEATIRFDGGNISAVQYIDRGFEHIEISIHMSFSDIDNLFSVDILNILKALENVAKDLRHTEFSFNFTILIGIAYVYLNKNKRIK